jgi:hypothetical protein
VGEDMRSRLRRPVHLRPGDTTGKDRIIPVRPAGAFRGQLGICW